MFIYLSQLCACCFGLSSACGKGEKRKNAIYSYFINFYTFIRVDDDDRVITCMDVSSRSTFMVRWFMGMFAGVWIMMIMNLLKQWWYEDEACCEEMDFSTVIFHVVMLTWDMRNEHVNVNKFIKSYVDELNMNLH